MPRKYVAVCGASEATASQLAAAREAGRLLAESGAVVINGVIALDSWSAKGLEAVDTPSAAVKRALG
jgi:hypothetical protein